MFIFRGALLMVRSLLVSACVISMALAAHLIGGGHLPDPLVGATAASLVLLATTLLAMSRLRPLALVGLLSAAQSLLHHAFSVPPAGGPPRHHLLGAVSGTEALT